MKVSLWAEIRRLYEVEGPTRRAIARRLHCCTKTVAKALARLTPPLPAPGPGEKESVIIDRYRAQIDALVAKYPDLSAVRVLEEISRGEQGYRGSVYPVRRYLRRVRPARGRVYQEVHYEPGEAMQVDWGDCGRLTIGKTPRRVSVFVAVLGYSRLRYIEFSLSQRKADFYRAVVHTLEFYGGSPRKIIFDNLKAAVISGSGRYACLHPEFLVQSDHRLAALKLRRRRQADQRVEEFDALGPEAREFHLKLLAMPVKPTVHLRRLLGLVRLYGRKEVLAAIRQALQYQTYDV